MLEQNGIAEWKNGFFIEMTRSLLTESALKKKYSDHITPVVFNQLYSA